MKIAEYCEWAGLEIGLEDGEGDLSIDQFTACCFLEAKDPPPCGKRLEFSVDFGYENAIQVLEALEKETA